MTLANARLAAQLHRDTERLFYTDAGVLLHDTATGSYDAYNKPVVTTTETAVDCAFTDKPSREDWQDIEDTENIDAEVRFKDANPVKGDRFKVTARFADDDYADTVFEIAGIRNRGAFGWACALRRVQV